MKRLIRAASPIVARSWVRGVVLGLFWVGVSGWCSKAFAQMQEAIAESLFEEGKQFYAEGKYPQACEKLAQSHKADPAGGTVLLLAMCYERQGRTASAWAKYSEAVSIARRDGREDRQKRAEEARTALESQLTYVNLVLAPEVISLSGVELRLDGFLIPSLTHTSVPIDPGSHTLTVAAPGYISSQHEFVGGEPKQTVMVEVNALMPVPVRPTLELKPQDSAVASSPPVSPVAPVASPIKASSSVLPTLGWIAGGMGVISVGVGGYFGYRAIKRDQTADGLCENGSWCDDPKGVSASQDAVDKANLSTIFVGGGIGALVGAAILFLVAPNDDQTGGVTTGLQSVPGGALVGVLGNY
jgi:hypothetical protein